MPDDRMTLIFITIVIYSVGAAPGVLWNLREQSRRLSPTLEIAASFAPLLAWWLLMLFVPAEKSISNMAGEPFIFGLTTSVCFFFRSACEDKACVKRAAMLATVAALALAVLIWFVTPLMRQ